MTTAQTTADRVARNEAIFRQANEGIRAAALEHLPEGEAPFICECAEPSCTEILRLTLTEYEAVRAASTHFINAPGHDANAGGWATVVEPRDGYDVVAKVGRAAKVVDELDPRKG